jgi:hypothetical protein
VEVEAEVLPLRKRNIVKDITWLSNFNRVLCLK